jgi:hypothetical protein
MILATIRWRLAATGLALIAFAASARAQDITSNLRGHWLLTETSGTTATDTSPSPHHGVYSNGVALGASIPVPVSGVRAADFDGYNDYVAVGTEWYFDVTGPLTVAAWIKVDAFTTAYQAILGKGTTAWGFARNNTTNGVLFVGTGLSPSTIASNASVNDGQWHHVVGVYTGSQLRIYIDGSLDNVVWCSGTLATNNANFSIGNDSLNPSSCFNGAIYDVRVYNRALSGADVSYLYLQGGPVGRWRLNETAGTTAADSSLYGRNGTTTGSPAWTYRCNGTGVLNFNGTSQYVAVSNAAHLQPTAALTIAGWIQGDAWGAGTDADAILRKGDANPNNYGLQISDGRIELLLDGNDGSGIRGNTVLKTGEWYHVAATWDGAYARLYLNGVLDNTPTARAAPIASDTRSLYIGGRLGADYFDGRIQEVVLYNRALTPSEIVRTAGLAGVWRFSEGAGATASDSSGVGNNASLNGATWTSDCAGNVAINFNGTGGVATTSASFNPPSTGTVAFWMRPAAASTLRRIFGNGGDWEVRQQPDNRVIFDLCGDGGTIVGTSVPLDDPARWYHVAYTFDSESDSYVIYIDGALHASGVNPVNMVKQPSGVLSFGTRTGSTEYWPGSVRDFRIFSRQLCPSEIAELSGLAAHWKMDETSGSTAADSSLAGRHAAVVGTPAWSAGKIDNAIQFNGSNYAWLAGLMDSPRNITIAAWANLTTPDSSGAEVISLGDCFAIRLNEGTQSKAFFFNGTTWQAAGVSQTFANAGWRHFAAVFNDDANTLKFYINGVEAASLSTTASIAYSGAGSNTFIGRHGNGNAAFDFVGRIDDARIYSRALCPSEIQQIYNSGSGGFQGVRILQWVETR